MEAFPQEFDWSNRSDVATLQRIVHFIKELCLLRCREYVNKYGMRGAPRRPKKSNTVYVEQKTDTDLEEQEQEEEEEELEERDKPVEVDTVLENVIRETRRRKYMADTPDDFESPMKKKKNYKT
jgi:hypothetical protein